MQASVDYQSTSPSARIPARAWAFLLSGWSALIIPTIVVRVAIGLYSPAVIVDVLRPVANHLAPWLSFPSAFRIMILVPLTIVNVTCITCAIRAIRNASHLQTRTSSAFCIAGLVLILAIVLPSLAMIYVLFMP